MICNNKMKELLSNIDLSTIEAKNYYSISQKENSNNEKYWIINKEIDCSIYHTHLIGKDLSNYEYKENEIYLANSIKVEEVFNLGIKIFVSIKNILKENYSDIKFDIIFYIDLGNDNITPSAIISFYAIRDNFRIIEEKDINYMCNTKAFLIETINI